MYQNTLVCKVHTLRPAYSRRLRLGKSRQTPVYLGTIRREGLSRPDAGGSDLAVVLICGWVNSRSSLNQSDPGWMNHAATRMISDDESGRGGWTRMLTTKRWLNDDERDPGVVRSWAEDRSMVIWRGQCMLVTDWLVEVVVGRWRSSGQVLLEADGRTTILVHRIWGRLGQSRA